jgi:hypothetical protein
MEKKCNKCEIVKSQENFYKSSGNICKECSKTYAQIKRKSDKEIEKINDEKKICKECNEEKNFSKFRKNRKLCKECEKKYCKEYRQSDIGKKKAQDWSKNNKEKHQKLIADWYQNNKQKINEKYNERRKTDFQFKLRINCKRRISLVITKNRSTDKYVGCDSADLSEWLKFCFDNTMTIENYGEIWHIDHVIPVDTFNLKKEEEQMICFNWKNLSPASINFNLTKNKNLDKKQIEKHIEKLQKFHKEKNMTEPYDYIAFLKSKI